MPQYSSCSLNNQCGCLPFSFSNDYSICALLTLNCSHLNPCQSPYDACPSQHVCVRHTRCDTRPLCYPMSSAHASVCPPIPSKLITTIEKHLSLRKFNVELANSYVDKCQQGIGDMIT